MNLWALDPDQREELGQHLRPVIGDADIDRAIAAIDMGVYACGVMPPTEWAALQKASRRHSAAIAATASDLQALLKGSPVWFGLDLSDLADTLGALAALARVPKRRKWRPSDGRRDDLIAIVAHVYPPGSVGPRGKHFAHLVRTVRLALSFIRAEPENVRPLVLEALRRRPEPPFFIVASK